MIRMFNYTSSLTDSKFSVIKVIISFMTQERDRNRSIGPYAPLPVTEELVIRARSGDEQAVEELVNILRPRIGGYFSVKLPTGAEDLT